MITQFILSNKGTKIEHFYTWTFQVTPLMVHVTNLIHKPACFGFNALRRVINAVTEKEIKFGESYTPEEEEDRSNSYKCLVISIKISYRIKIQEALYQMINIICKN